MLSCRRLRVLALHTLVLCLLPWSAVAADDQSPPLTVERFGQVASELAHSSELEGVAGGLEAIVEAGYIPLLHAEYVAGLERKSVLAMNAFKNANGEILEKAERLNNCGYFGSLYYALLSGNPQGTWSMSAYKKFAERLQAAVDSAQSPTVANAVALLTRKGSIGLLWFCVGGETPPGDVPLANISMLLEARQASLGAVGQAEVRRAYEFLAMEGFIRVFCKSLAQSAAVGPVDGVRAVEIARRFALATYGYSGPATFISTIDEGVVYVIALGLARSEVSSQFAKQPGGFFRYNRMVTTTSTYIITRDVTVTIDKKTGVVRDSAAGPERKTLNSSRTNSGVY